MREYYQDIVSFMLGESEKGPNRYSLANQENMPESMKDYKMTWPGEPYHEENIGGMYRNVVSITKDGIFISIQCGEGFYCFPKVSFPIDRENLERYESFEIGFPSREIPEFMEYAESPEMPTQTVYSDVPKELVNKFIAEHGGIAPLETAETKLWNGKRDQNIEEAWKMLKWNEKNQEPPKEA